MPRGSFTTPTSQADPSKLVTGTPEQEAIWDVLLNTDKHVIVEAVAGSGKTFVLTQYAMRERHAKIGLTAFNKHIATELTQRMGGQSNVECMTYHSLGYKAVRNGLRGKVQVDQYKVLSMLDNISLPVKQAQEKVAKYRISSMVSYAKTYGHGPDVDREVLEKIADRHDVDLNGLNELVMDYTPKILKKCMQMTATIDFDDMVWLPVVLGLAVPKYDVLCVDEYQDTGVTQQWLAVRGGVRVCAVGDPRQAIYSFRGCDGTGFDKLRMELPDVVTLPLTLTRRCPKSHVELAQIIVPKIQALEHAPDGVVRVTPDLDTAINEMRPGDLCVCRVNAELVGTAYKLLKRGVKAVVRGRDIGAGMTKLIDAAVKRCAEVTPTLPDAMQEAGAITNEVVSKFLVMPNGRGEMRAANAQDKYECLGELSENCKTVSELRSVIERLFSEFEDDGTPKNAVVLGTVHRTKGLEANRVFVLRPDLIPHPMAKKKEDQHAELNLLYVACTRAKFDETHKGELIFVGCLPSPLGELDGQSEGQGSLEAGNEPTNDPTSENDLSTDLEDYDETLSRDEVVARWSEDDLHSNGERK